MHLFWPKVQVWWKFYQNRFGSFSASLGSIQRQQHTYKPIFLGLRSPETLTTRQGFFDDHTTFSISLWESETVVRKWSGMPQQRPQSERRSAVRCLLCCVLGGVGWGGEGGDSSMFCQSAGLNVKAHASPPSFPPALPPRIKLLTQHFVTSLWRNATDRPIIAARFASPVRRRFRPGTPRVSLGSCGRSSVSDDRTKVWTTVRARAFIMRWRLHGPR